MVEITESPSFEKTPPSRKQEIPFPNPMQMIKTEDVEVMSLVSDASSNNSEYNSCGNDILVSAITDNEKYDPFTSTTYDSADPEMRLKNKRTDDAASIYSSENLELNHDKSSVEDSEDDQLINELVSFDEENNNDIMRNTIQHESAQRSYDRESKEVKGRPSACVFVASLSSNLNDDILCQSVTNHFRQWGKISLVKVLRDPANRPYAFVQYTTDEDANRAIAEGQHSILNGRTVRCEKARVNRTLYLQIANVGINERIMKKLMSKFGEIERIISVNDNFNVITSPKNGLHKNWFCKFVYRQDAISAFANLKSKANWTIEWAQNLEDEYSSVPEVTIDRYSIFVGHLDPRISKEEMVDRFEKHGKIKEAILVNRPLSNFAFIKFKTKEAAAAAVESENHSMFKYKTIHVQYRELYNNYRRKFSTDHGLKLNLAPPPVNFKRRGYYDENKKQKYHKNSGLPCNNDQLQIERNSFFDDTSNIGSLSSANTNNNTFASAMKARHRFTSKGRIGSNFTSPDNQDPVIRNLHTPFLNRVSFDPSKVSDFEAYIPEEASKKNPAILQESTTGINFEETEVTNSEKNNETQIKGNNENGDNKENEENDIIASEHDMSTVRSSNTFSRSGLKSGHTYSSIGNSESENMFAGHIKTASNYQYPYYYYYPPAKEMQYMNPMMGFEPPSMVPPPNSGISSMAANPGYFIAYPPSFNNFPPSTGNAQMQGLYPPYYLYYNNMVPGNNTKLEKKEPDLHVPAKNRG